MKDMNFLMFMDFSIIFLIFYEFIWIYFELKTIKKSYFYRVLTWCKQKCDTMRQRMNTSCGARRMNVRVCSPVRAFTHVCSCVHVSD